jgi:Actinobacteria/chloroflexi VLRF1 release factor
MVGRPAAGGGRWIDVDPERLPRWVSGFADRHGAPAASRGADCLTLLAADGTVASLFPPPGPATVPERLAEFESAAVAPYRLGLLLARRAGVAIGIADGTELVSSKVDKSYVQGRTAAGGWSQQRFARRRDNQARSAAADAADLVARMLLGEVSRLAAVVTGGDRRAVAAVLADARLAPVARLCVPRFLQTAEPSLRALQEAVRSARSVRIRIIESAPP